MAEEIENNALAQRGTNTPQQNKADKDSCPLCLKKLVRFDMGELDGGRRIYSCQQCGSIFFDPDITRYELDNFYSELEPEVVHISGYVRYIKKIQKTINKVVPNRANKNFLCINMLQGYAVEAAKYLGFKTVRGIDRYDFFADFAKNNFGAEFFEAVSTEEYAERGEKADVIFSLETFCLQPDPEPYMAAIARLLNKGGILYIEEVDGNSHFLPNDLTRWLYLNPPITSKFISEQAMRLLLERHGFKVQKKFFHWGVMMKLIAVKIK